MTKRAPNPIEPRPTPPPKNPEELAQTVAIIADRLKTTNEILLPDIKTAAAEAKEAAVNLDIRVAVLEEHIPHPCDEKPRQARQDQDIVDMKGSDIEHKEQLKGLFKFRNFLIGAIVFVVGASVTFALITRATEAANSANIMTNRDDIDRHEDLIKELPTKRDLQAVRTAVNGVPEATAVAVKNAAASEPPTVDGVEEDMEDLPFNKSERAWLQKMFERARKRENGEHYNGKR